MTSRYEAQLYTEDVEADMCVSDLIIKDTESVQFGSNGTSAMRWLGIIIMTRMSNAPYSLGKPLTIHTREAEEDSERILKSEVPNDHMDCAEAELMSDVQIHVHWFTG
jgi:TatD DNase family protein